MGSAFTASAAKKENQGFTPPMNRISLSPALWRANAYESERVESLFENAPIGASEIALPRFLKRTLRPLDGHGGLTPGGNPVIGAAFRTNPNYKVD